MAKRFYSTYKSTKNLTYNVEIWDTAFAGTATSFDIGEGGFQLRMSGEGDEILNHISPTDCEFEYMLANSTDFALVTDLSVAAEGRFTIKISKGTGTPTPFWYGQVVPDVGSYSEENYPQKFTIRATDGIGLLKTIDFKDTSAAYAGKERALFMIKNALKKLPYVSIHWGTGDNFIATVMDTWEETMDNGGTDPCALFQTYLDYSVWQTYEKGEEQYTSCYDVIKNILTPFGARLTTRNGVFWIEQMFYRPETTVIVRTYTRDGGLSSADNYGTINDINQTAGGALLAVGEYEFFPALRRVEHLYEINLRRNFLESVSPLDETFTSQTIKKPIDGSTDSTTLRLSGNFTYSIRSNIFDGTGNTPLAPFCIILRINLTLDTLGLVRNYNLDPSYQVIYSPMEWDVIPSFYVAIPVTNTGFLSNLTDYIFSGTQSLDVFTPLIPESCENFNIDIEFVTFKKFNGGTYFPVDFDLTFELTKPWLEAYSFGDPAITEDEQLYYANNPDSPNNSELFETSSIVGTSLDPNALGAFWVKPAATYQLANYWAIGAGTPDRPVEVIMVGATLAQQKTPVRKIQGTFYGSIDILARYLWDGVYWLVLGGSLDADNDQFTGTLVELREYETATFSPPIKRKKFLVSNTLPTAPPASGQGGPVYDLIAKPPATLIYSVALTTTDEALLSGAITSLPISETMVANDVLDGDTVVIVNPLTGDFEELTVTATAAGGETAIAVSGTLAVNYPANSPIVRRPRLGRFFLPEGTTGDILYYNGTAWVVLNIGTTGQGLTVISGLPAWADVLNVAAGTGITITGTTTKTIFANLSTGIAGGQSAIGGTAAGENLRLSSTTNATKGSILFGASSFNETNNRLSIGNTTGGAKVDITAEENRATLGAELITNAADRDFSSDTGNWTGTNWTIGGGVATHTVAGNNDFTLSTSVLLSVSGTRYLIVFTVNTTTAGSFGTLPFVSFGGQGGSFGAETGSVTYNVVVFATAATALTFTPGSVWLGTIDNVSVKAITTTTPFLQTRGTTGTVVNEMRTITAANGSINIGIGLDSISSLYTLGPNGVNNVALGHRALRSVTTGNRNFALGTNALTLITNGSNNVGIGTSAIQSLISGSDNFGIGSNTFASLTRGSNNVGIGSFVLNTLLSGSNNIAIGYQAADAMTVGSNNIAIGHDVDLPSSTGSNQLTIGNIIFGTGIDGTGTTVSSGNLGIKNAAPAQTLDVTGTVRISGSTGTATTITGRNASGDISNVAVGSGLSLTGGTLSATATGTITGTMTATRVQFAASATALDDDANLTWDDTNKRLLIGTGATAAFLNVFSGAITGTTEFLRMSGNINGNMIAYLLNANNASTGANAFFGISVGGASAGDPFMQYIISGVRTWSQGVDNSDSDNFKISTDSTVGASTASDVFVLGTDGRASIGGAALIAGVNLVVAGTGAIRLPSGTTAQQPAGINPIIRNNTTVGGLEFKNTNGQWHRITGTSQPSVSTGAGAGTGATATIVGTDRGFRLNLTTGTAPTANGDIVTITYGQPFQIQPYIATSPYNAQAATDYNKYYIVSVGVGASGPAGFTLRANGTLTGGSPGPDYVISFVIQQ